MLTSTLLYTNFFGKHWLYENQPDFSKHPAFATLYPHEVSLT